jgi:FkbM family methyltransferase
MNDSLQYKIRGLTYWLECANPFRNTVTARHLPLGLRMLGYKRDAVGRGLYRRGVHEPGLTKFLLDTFSNAPGGHFIDAGANIGYFSCLLSKLAGPNGSVLSIEPEPQNRRLLENNLKLNGLTNVVVHPCALGASEGSARMGIYKPANRGRHSLVDLESCKSFIEVPVRRLDDLVRESAPAVKSWALLKIDVEGYEPFAFEGAAETLSRTEILAMEYAPSYWNKAGVAPATVFKKLASNFSRIFQIRKMDLVEVTAQDCARAEETLDLIFHR